MTPEQILDDTLYQLKQFTLLANLTDGQRKRLKEIIWHAQQFTAADAAIASQPVPAPDLVERCRNVLRSFAVSFGKPVHLGQVLSTQELDALARAIIPIIQADEREECARVAEKWRDENKANAARARKRESLDGIGGYESPQMAEMLDGAAIECNAIATAIRERNGRV